MVASPVDVTRGVVTCRSNASVPDVQRLGHCACANIDELATAGSPPEEHLSGRLMMNDDDSLERWDLRSTRRAGDPFRFNPKSLTL